MLVRQPPSRFTKVWRLGSSYSSESVWYHPASWTTLAGSSASLLLRVRAPFHTPALFGLNGPLVWLPLCGGTEVATNLIVRSSAPPSGATFVPGAGGLTSTHGPWID